MDWISLSALSGAANNANAGGGGGGGPSPSPTPSPSPSITPERTDEHYANTVLLLHGDGNPGANNVNNPAPIAQYMAISDDSPNDRQVSTVGANVYGTDFNPFYYNAGVFSNEFTGNGNLRVENESEFDLGTDSFTMECWVFPHAQGQYHLLIQKWDPSSNKTFAFQIGNSSNELQFVYTTNGSTNASLTGSTAIPAGRWTHVAVTRDGQTLRLFVNGVIDATNSSFTASLYNGTAPLTIGSDADGGTYTDANISNARFIGGRALYTAAFSLPTTPFEDPTTHGELSVYFDGSGDGLNAGTDARFLPVANEDFTFEAWVYLTATPGAQGAQIMGIQEYGTSSDWIFYVGSDLVPDIWIQAAGSGSGVAYAGSTAIKLNEWTHIAWSRSGTGSNNMKLFINGVQDAQHTYTGTMKYSGTTGLTLGSDGAFDEALLTGYISNARIIKGTGLYTTGFTPPSALTAVDNTTFLSCQGKTFQDYSSTNAPIARGGNAHISEFGPFGDGYWSNDFSGDAELVQAASSSDFQLGSSEFTIEGWFYPTTTGDSGYYCIVGQQTHSGGLGWGIWRNGPDGYIQIWLDAGATKVGGAVALGSGEVNVWNHFVAQRDSSDYISFYLNGTRTGYSVDATHSDSSSILGIGLASTTTGWNASYKFDGYISNIRITKGSALYSGTSITVPTAPYTTTSQGASASEVKLLTCQSNRFIDNSDSAHSLTVTNSPGISERIPFEYLQRQTKLITCQENRFKDIINYRHIINPSGSTAKVSTKSPFSSNASYKTANTGAIYMDGTSFVTVDDQAESFKFGTEDYTMEAWVYDLSTDTTQRTIFGRNGTGNLSIPYVYKVPTSEVFSLYYSSGIVSSTRKIYKGEWTHLALCRENGTSRVFVNGEFQGTGADTTNIVTPVKLVIGNNGGSSSNLGWIGYIYGARVEKGRAKYTSNASFNPASTQPALANSANTGAISTNQFSNFFDGTDHLANTAVVSMNDYGFSNANDFTIEMWFNAKDLPGSDMLLYDGRVANGAYPAVILNSANKILWYVNTSALITSRALLVGNWYHLAIVRFGNQTTMYLDGLREGAVYTDTIDYSHGDINIGLNQPAGGEQFRGWIHGLNILNGVAKYTSNTAITYSPVSKIGTSNTNGSFSRYIPGLSTKIAIPTTGLPMGAQHRTIEFWAKVNAFGSQTTQYMVAYGVNGSAQVYSIALSSAGALRVVGYSLDYTTSATVPLDTWFHVSVNYDGTNNIVFLNGMRVDKRSHAINTGAHTFLYVNADAAGGAGTYAHPNGFQICDLAVYNVAIRSAVSDSGFIPPTTATTIASNNNIVLLGSQSNTGIELANNVLSGGYDQSALSSETPFDNGYWSVWFDGSGDYLQSDLPSLGNEWTVQFWISRYGSGVNSTFTIGDSQTVNGIELYWGNSGNSLYVYGTDQILINGGNTIAENSGLWTHYAIVKDTNNDLTLYQNGLRLGPVKTGYNPSPGGATSLRIGCEYYNSAITNYLTGKLSNFKVSNTAVYSANTTVPTSPLTKDNNTVFLGCQSGAIIDNGLANSSLGYTISVNGNARTSRSRPFSDELSRDQVLLACQDRESIKDNSHLDTKLTRTSDVTRSADNPFDDGFWSGQFDGTDDVLSVYDDDNLDFGTGDWTIECWIKQTKAFADFQTIWSKYASNLGYYLHTRSTGTILIGVSNVTSSTSTAAITLNKWHHIAVTRNSNVLYVWLDGVQIDTLSTSSNLDNTTPFLIGNLNGFSRYFGGFISNFRVVKGTALYTDTFTPSTSPFTTTSQGATASEVSLLTCQSSNHVDNSNKLIGIVETGGNTRPVFPDNFTDTIPQQTTFLTGKFPGSIRNVGFLDESSNNTTVVPQNQVTQGSFTPHYPPTGYWSVGDISGSNYIDITNDASFVPGTGDFTVEFFLSHTTMAGYQTPFSLGYNSAGDLAIQTGNGDGRWIVYISGAAIATESSTTVKAGQWYHIAVVRNGSNIVIYRDGVSVATGTSSTNINTSTNLRIGTGTAFGNPFLGSISNLRVAKSAVYTSAFTRPSEPLTTSSQSATNVGLLTAKSNRFIDESSESHSLSITGSPKVQSFFPFDLTTSYDAYEHGGSAYFDGTDDRLSLPLTAFTNLLGNDFTFECWYYGETNSSANKTLFSQGSGYSPLSVYHYGNGIRYNLSTGGSWTKQDTSTYGSNGFINQWNHVAISRSGSNFAAFLNGTRVDDYTNAITLMTPTESTHIGARNGNDFDYKGYVSSWRLIINEAIYDPTQNTLTLPTAPFRNTANTRALLNFTNAGIYDSTGKNNLLITGDSRISTGAANTKFGTGSLSFDGDDYITVTDSANERLFTAKDSDFTWEAFVKFNALSGLHTLWSKYGSGSEYQFYYDSSNNDWRLSYHSSTYTFSDADIETGKWYHVALVKQGTNHTVFRDGQRKGAVASASYPTQRSVIGFVLGTTFNGSDSALYGFNGFLDEVRVTKGLARYTANFTPMTAASGNKTS